MAKFRASLSRDVQMVVDDQADVCAPGDGQNRLRHSADFVRRGFFGAELDQIRAAVAKLLGKDFRRAAMEVGRVNKSVKPAVGERFHGDNLTTKHTKHTKEFRDAAKFAKRLDCGDFSTAFRPHQDYPPFHVLRPLDSAAKAGALQTLRDKDLCSTKPATRITVSFQTPSARTSRSARRT